VEEISHNSVSGRTLLLVTRENLLGRLACRVRLPSKSCRCIGNSTGLSGGRSVGGAGLFDLVAQLFLNLAMQWFRSIADVFVIYN